jgi:hypothetical protein
MVVFSSAELFPALAKHAMKWQNFAMAAVGEGGGGDGDPLLEVRHQLVVYILSGWSWPTLLIYSSSLSKVIVHHHFNIQICF